MDNLIQLIIKDFGPAGGLAILLLCGSLWANWQQFKRLNKEHDKLADADRVHSTELLTCRLDCEREKTIYRDTIDKHYQEAVSVFLDRDNQKRQDLASMIERFERLVGVISDGLAKVTASNNELRYQLKGQMRAGT